jgi:hypothetical protein
MGCCDSRNDESQVHNTHEAKAVKPKKALTAVKYTQTSFDLSSQAHKTNNLAVFPKENSEKNSPKLAKNAGEVRTAQVSVYIKKQMLKIKLKLMIKKKF